MCAWLPVGEPIGRCINIECAGRHLVEWHDEPETVRTMSVGGRLTALLGLTLLLGLCVSSAARADIYWGNYLSFGDEGTSYIGHARVNGSEANAQFLNIKT
jgi:hypothetical protein